MVMEYFTKKEMIRCFCEEKSERCKECKLVKPAMRLPNGIEENIEALVQNVLDPVRERLGKPITVNSGYRCPLHNSTVGGVMSSQHVKGEAADLNAGSPEENRRLARIIVANGKFDQLILYPGFLHLSYKRAGVNRKQILRKTSAGYQKIAPSDI